MNQQKPSAPILPSQRPLIYLITDRKTLHPDPGHQPTDLDAQLAVIKTAVAAGCQLIQIRERDLDRGHLSALVKAAIEIARPQGALIMVNHDIDVAIASGADGVHLRVTSMRPVEARRLAQERGRENLLIGASTHSIPEAIETAAGADFIVCGPIYETTSKRDFGDPIGLAAFASVVRAVEVPVLGIGGVTAANFREVLDCGAAGIAGIGLFSNPETVDTNVRTILGAI